MTIPCCVMGVSVALWVPYLPPNLPDSLSFRIHIWTMMNSNGFVVFSFFVSSRLGPRQWGQTPQNNYALDYVNDDMSVVPPPSLPGSNITLQDGGRRIPPKCHQSYCFEGRIRFAGEAASHADKPSVASRPPHMCTRVYVCQCEC